MIARVLSLVFLINGVQSAPQQPPLIVTIQAHDIAGARSLLQAGADPNAREFVVSKPSVSDGVVGGRVSEGSTALDLAVERQSTALVRLLLSYKADPNAHEQYGWTALMTACQRNNEHVVKLLLEHGANPNAQNENGDTAIIFAANVDRVEIVADLIKARADMNGGSGITALMISAQCGSNKSIKFLLESGANPNFRRAGWPTALEFATQSYDSETYSILRKAGAKGKSKRQLEKEEAARSNVYKAKSDALAAKNVAFAKASLEDSALIEAAVADMAIFKGDIEFSTSGEKNVVLYDSTIGGANDQTEAQINGEVDSAEAADLDLAMRRDLLRRNCQEVSLSTLKFTSPLILLMDGAKAKTSFFGRCGVAAKAKGWVKVMLPGYSDDGTRAVLRFFDGPSPHGAAGTYFLAKKDGVWKVKWRKFAHYV